MERRRGVAENTDGNSVNAKFIPIIESFVSVYMRTDGRALHQRVRRQQHTTGCLIFANDEIPERALMEI